MVELTDDEAENLGRGLSFSPRWDFDDRGGSMRLINGIDLLGRDLAFAASQELDDLRGRLLTPDDREDIKIAVRRVANRDDRVARLETPLEVEPADDPAVANVSVTIVAMTGERGEGVLTI